MGADIMHNGATQTQEKTLYTASQWKLMRLAFMKHRLAVVGGIIVVVFYLIAIFAEFVAPYDPDHRDMESQFVPPMRLHIITPEGKLYRPFVYPLVEVRDFETFAVRYEEDESAIYPIRFWVHGDRYKFWGVFWTDVHLFGVDGDQRYYLLGTDQQARDMFSRIVYGTRLSMSIGLIGVAISFVLAIVFGTISGYFGGLADIIIQRVIEVIMCVPSLPLWMALAVAIPLTWSITKVFFFITLILSLVGWAGLARAVRSKLLALREADYAVSAKLDNVAVIRIMFRHLIPGVLSHLIASLTLSIPSMILGETSLSFLGIGLRPPAISWGVLLQSAQNIQTVALSPWLLLPVVPIVVIILSFNFLGDGLRDAADPYKS